MLIQPASVTKQQQKQKEKEISKDAKANNVEKKTQIEKENIQPASTKEQSSRTTDGEKSTEADEILKKREEFMKKQMAKPSPKAATYIHSCSFFFSQIRKN